MLCTNRFQVFFVLLMVVGFLAQPETAAGQSKTNQALVIGNSAYRDAPLPNAANDARAIADALKASGFRVALHIDADHRSMVAALRDFGDRLRSGSVGLFYYAGHGMQIKGRNYLIPVGAAIAREDEVAYAALDAQAVLDKMEAAGNATNLMILDACRNNPFSRSFRSNTQGLAQMDAPVGTLLAFATAPGSVASDGTGSNGLYTQHLLAAMQQPGLKVEDVFKQVRARVRRDSDGKQIPWESTSLEGDFYFRVGAVSGTAPTASATGGSAAARTALDQAMWDVVRTSQQPLELRAYLARFPQGQFAAQARARLEQTTATSQVSTPNARPNSAPGTDVAGQNVLQADVDRRTQEILGELARVSPSPASTPSTTRPISSKPPPVPNAAGFAIGDRLRFQIVDKYRGEVVDNYTWKLDRILPNGDLSWNGGNLVTTANGNNRKRDVTKVWKERSYTDASTWLPANLREGHRENVRYVAQGQKVDGYSYREEVEGTLKVKGRERVKVPAGDFDAWRIEGDYTLNGTRTDKPANWYGRALFVGWYVPELRAFVARDHENRIGSEPPSRNRIELTSYELASSWAAKR